MNLSPHITIEEFERTSKPVPNKLPTGLMQNAVRTADMLEKIRAALGGVPILISSGYRSLALNRSLNSKDTSDHVQACAADFTAPKYGTPLQIAELLAPQVSVLGIGQLIHEYGSWIHVSTRVPSNAANRIITIDNQGVRVGIHKARP